MKPLYSLYAVYSSGFNLVWRILPAFLAAFFGAFEISLIYTAYFAARVLIIPAALASDRLGTVKAIRLSFSLMILMILGFIFFFGAKSLPGWIVFALVAGVVVNLIEIAAAALAASVKKKTKTLLGLESMYQIGVVVGPIVGGFLAMSFGIESALLTWAALNLVGILLTTKLRIQGQRVKRISKGLFSVIRQHKFAFVMVLVVGSFFTGFLQAMQEIILALFATKVGFDVARVGLIIGGGSLITVVALLLIGKKIDTKSPFTMLFVFFALMLVFPLIVPFLHDFVSLVIIGGVFLVGRASNLNISRSFFSEFSDVYKATAIGIGETVYYLSRSVGSAATGVMLEGFGYGGAFTAMVVLTVVAMAGAVILILYKRKR